MLQFKDHDLILVSFNTLVAKFGEMLVNSILSKEFLDDVDYYICKNCNLIIFKEKIQDTIVNNIITEFNISNLNTNIKEIINLSCTEVIIQNIII